MMTKILSVDLIGERSLSFDLALLVGDPYWPRIRRTSNRLVKRAKRRGSIVSPAQMRTMNTIYEGALKTMSKKEAEDLIGGDEQPKKGKKKVAMKVKDEKPTKKKAAKEDKPSKKAKAKPRAASNKGTEEDIESAKKVLLSKVKAKIATAEFAEKYSLNPIVVRRAAKRLKAEKKLKAMQEGRYWYVAAR